MGSEIVGEAAREFEEARPFYIRVVGHRPVVAIELVRTDGQVEDVCDICCQYPPGLDTFDVDFNEHGPLDASAAGAAFYYVRVTEADGRMAWSSPIWLIP